MWKIRLTLQNNKTLELNDVRSSVPGWSDCEPSGIEKLEFTFPGKDEHTGKETPHTLVMSGMKEYNFFVEAMKSLSGNSRVKIQALWFMGKLPGSNRITGFVLKDSVLALNTTIGKEYQGMPTGGWKKGIIGNKVVSTVIRRML
jgi:hypothetical protein